MRNANWKLAYNYFSVLESWQKTQFNILAHKTELELVNVGTRKKEKWNWRITTNIGNVHMWSKGETKRADNCIFWRSLNNLPNRRFLGFVYTKFDLCSLYDW